MSISLLQEENDRELILIASSLGVETVSHKNLTDELVRGTKLHQKATTKIFLGNYDLIIGLKGFILSSPPNYYIFIDMGFYHLLNEGERKALIAHELGHIVYDFSFMDKRQLEIMFKFNIFRERYYTITTKYQIMADRFSAERTSPETAIAVLNKVYQIDKKTPAYKIRLENLEKLKQGLVH